MSKEFRVEVYTSKCRLISADVSEVVLPAYDGECGILAEHRDYVGLLGKGVMKRVEGGNDYWLVVSSGLFEVEKGKVTVLAEFAEEPGDIDYEAADARVKELEGIFSNTQKFSPEDFPAQREEYELLKARLEVHRRTRVVN